MKKFCFLVLIIPVFSTSWAQNTFLEYGKAIKVYNQSTYELRTRSTATGDSNMNIHLETTKAYRFIQPVLAYQWKSGTGNFHEIGMSGIRFTKTSKEAEIIDGSTGKGELVGGQDILEATLAFQYEYIWNFYHKAEHKTVPSLGFGASTYYSLIRREPRIANAFPTSETQAGLQLFLTPRLTHYLSTRWFLDVNFPICISDLNTTVFHVKNPAFTASQQRSSTQTLTGFPKVYSLRIGVGLKL